MEGADRSLARSLSFVSFRLQTLGRPTQQKVVQIISARVVPVYARPVTRAPRSRNERDTCTMRPRQQRSPNEKPETPWAKPVCIAVFPAVVVIFATREGVWESLERQRRAIQVRSCKTIQRSWRQHALRVFATAVSARAFSDSLFAFWNGARGCDGRSDYCVCVGCFRTR